jgi:hypothetical protein
MMWPFSMFTDPASTAITSNDKNERRKQMRDTKFIVRQKSV